MHQEDLAQCTTVSVLKEDLMDIDDKASTIMKKPSTSKISLPFKVNKSYQSINDSVSTANTISSLSLSKEDLFLVPSLRNDKETTQFVVDYIQEIYSNLLICTKSHCYTNITISDKKENGLKLSDRSTDYRMRV